MATVTPSKALNDTTLPTAIEHSFSFTLKFVSTFALIVIIILTLLGNSLVIGAFVAFRKLRNVTNYFVASLAVTDILVAVFSMPLWAAYLLTGTVVKIPSRFILCYYKACSSSADEVQYSFQTFNISLRSQIYLHHLHKVMHSEINSYRFGIHSFSAKFSGDIANIVSNIWVVNFFLGTIYYFEISHFFPEIL